MKNFYEEKKAKKNILDYSKHGVSKNLEFRIYTSNLLISKKIIVTLWRK